MTRFFSAPTTPRASTISSRLLCASIIALSVPLQASAATLKVDDDGAQCPGAYTTIQAAVLAAPAGATIKVCPGTYSGQVVISQSLKIKGKAPKAKTCNTLAAPDPTLHSIYQAPAVLGVPGRGIVVTASGVTIDGLVITQAGETGIWTDPSSVSKFKLKKSVLIANSDGIQFHSSGATKGSDKSSVKSNCFYQNTVGGIRTRYGLDDATISKNFFFETAEAAAIIIDQDPGVTNDHLTVTGNQSQGDSTFAVILGTRDSVFSKNTVNQTGGTAIFVGGNNVNLDIIGNTVTNAGTRGIRFNTVAFPASPNVASTGVEVSKNVIDNAGASGNGAFRSSGIVADSSAGESTLVLSTIEKNTVTNSGQANGNGDGIRIEDTGPGANGGNKIEGNKISGSFNHDCHDSTAGGGTAGTANDWSSNDGTATTQNVANLCFTGAANGTPD